MWVLLLAVASVLVACGHGAAPDWTAKFRSIPSAARCAEAEQVFTSAPHVAGSPEDEALAQYVLKSFEASGLRAWMHTTNPLLTLPGKRAIKVLAPVSAELSLQEAVIPEDPSTSDDRIVPTFNAYSANGTVTAPLVYANYGRPEDWALLPPGFGKGKIALVRYGALFRGLKVRIAQEQGAVGVIIFSDPQDDGFTRGPVFPDGPWRPPTSVQRGSAQLTRFVSRCARTNDMHAQVSVHLPWRSGAQRVQRHAEGPHSVCARAAHQLCGRHAAAEQYWRPGSAAVLSGRPQLDVPHWGCQLRLHVD